MRVAYGLKNLLSLPEGSFVGICMSNKPEWVLTDFACVFNNFVSVGLMTNWPKNEVELILNNSDIKCVVCDKIYLKRFLSLAKKCKTLKSVVCVESREDDGNTQEHARAKIIHGKVERKRGEVAVYTFEEVERHGDSKGETEFETYSGIRLSSPPFSQALASIVKPRKPDDLMCLIYSSGTTGMYMASYY